jgi:phage terminase large subunit-like protein
MEALMQEAQRKQAQGVDGSLWRRVARPKQLPPGGDWLVWLLLAGRGFGKTRAIVEWAHEQALAFPGSRGALVGSTAGDVRDILVEGESGLVTMHPDIAYESSKKRCTWPNGSQAALFSADEPDRLRGPQYHWGVCDEIAAWTRPSTFDMFMLGLRLGKTPRCAIATTPRPIPIIKNLIKQPTTAVVTGSTYENEANLSPHFFNTVVAKYEGTRLGRQEISAEILDDAARALWKRDELEAHRVTEHPALQRIVVAVDPSISSGGDEAGILVAGRGVDRQYYALEDASLQASPDQWAFAAVTEYRKHLANELVAEKNQGGEMVALTIKTVKGAPEVRLIHASRGKQARAEPVAALYEQGKVHHVGFFPQLEDELCSWEPNSGMPSPNRLDALVYAVTALMLDDGSAGGEVEQWEG